MIHLQVNLRDEMDPILEDHLADMFITVRDPRLGVKSNYL
jgi:hypothetical protein